MEGLLGRAEMGGLDSLPSRRDDGPQLAGRHTTAYEQLRRPLHVLMLESARCQARARVDLMQLRVVGS